MRRSSNRILTLALLAILVLALSAAADTLELKDGRLVKGKYLRGTPANIHFLVDGKVKIYPIAEISALVFGDEGASPAAPARQPGKSPAPGAPGTLTAPAGTRLVVRMIDAVDSESNKVGDTFRASLDEDLAVEGHVVAAQGTEVKGRLVEAKEAGRFAGKSELKLELTEMMINQQTYALTTGDYEVAGSSRGADTAKKVAAGAAIGAVVGAIAGGGKGAAIGAGVGAGAGTAIQVFTRGEQVKVPSETRLEFALEQPLTVRTPARSRSR